MMIRLKKFIGVLRKWNRVDDEGRFVIYTTDEKRFALPLVPYLCKSIYISWCFSGSLNKNLDYQVMAPSDLIAMWLENWRKLCSTPLLVQAATILINFFWSRIFQSMFTFIYMAIENLMCVM